MDQNQSNLVLQKKVKVFSTVGRSGIEYTTSATTWGTLCQEILNNYPNAASMKALIGETQLGLETPDSQLPAGDFQLFLFPLATKSGAISLERQQIAAAIAEYGDVAKNHFNVDQNYTRKGKDEHVKLLKSWDKKVASGKVKPAVAEPGKGVPAAKKVSKIADPLKEDKVKATRTTTTTTTVEGPSEEVKKGISGVLGGLKAASEEAAEEVVGKGKESDEILLTDNDRLIAAFILIQDLSDRRIPSFNKEQCLVQMTSIASRLGVQLPTFEQSQSNLEWINRVARQVKGIKGY